MHPLKRWWRNATPESRARLRRMGLQPFQIASAANHADTIERVCAEIGDRDLYDEWMRWRDARRPVVGDHPLAAWRHDRGMSMSDVGDKIGCSRQAVSILESHRNRDATIDRVCHALGDEGLRDEWRGWKRRLDRRWEVD